MPTHPAHLLKFHIHMLTQPHPKNHNLILKSLISSFFNLISDYTTTVHLFLYIFLS